MIAQTINRLRMEDVDKQFEKVGWKSLRNACIQSDKSIIISIVVLH